ncbi:TetR/AcrR family transcriptional regulator [Shimazuella sp. AN120528]|uniref:TetR/AcrR family transcriptional regulator n=1 Tax=Shimazuella soli TaxID=1892854 RepID=UPI001F0DEDA0|nr:TetR/AcrR family transcriptional regulator [Shimazuella soli]MCH5584189.1 TetR/AcrR family transcriptional regulator [Shimazuella soli]
MNNKTKLSWLHEGFAVLEEAGPEQLTIDELCRRLKLTKGSFYHHFKNRQDYIHSLMQLYEEDRTHGIIELSKEGESPRNKLDRLTELVTSLVDSTIEMKIRAWASHDETIHSYQQRVDESRINYVKELCENVYKDRVDAELLAKIYYTLFIGAQHLIPPIKSKELFHIYKTIREYIRNGNKSI